MQNACNNCQLNEIQNTNTHTKSQIQNRNQKYFACSITNCSLTRCDRDIAHYVCESCVSSSPPPLCLLRLLPSMLTANSQQQAPLQRGLMAVWAWHSAHCVCKLVIRIVAATVAAPCRVVILITSACLPVLLWPLPCFSLSLLLSVCLPHCLSVSLFVYLSIACCAC